jgi:hypothetical protein
MSSEKVVTQDKVVGTLSANLPGQESATAGGEYLVECRDQDGNLKWSLRDHNLVVNVGAADMNNKYFAGASYSATWYLGLITGPGVTTSASDTMASHGWTEFVGYSNATRVSCSFGSATTASPSVITNSASASIFNINASGVVGGAFLTNNNVKGGSTGILFSEKAFSAPGDRTVIAGDTLTVTYTFSLTPT